MLGATGVLPPVFWLASPAIYLSKYPGDFLSIALACAMWLIKSTKPTDTVIWQSTLFWSLVWIKVMAGASEATVRIGWASSFWRYFASNESYKSLPICMATFTPLG